MKKAQEIIDTIINKQKNYSLNLSNQDLTGEMNLSEFANLTKISADGNHFDNLDWLTTLPNKEKLKWLNLWNNEIKRVNFAFLLDNFPNTKINLTNNPLNGDNLKDLSSQQFSLLVEWIENGKLKVNSWKGNLLTDLLSYTKDLKEELIILKEEKLIAQQIQNIKL
ncbi:MAG: hypothetical protein mread185_000426 [Mycoplasmataceae bacterium]|nr:MAG: hypothetical protein mread185_000426 [Mycoplasmataceae bacterium]